MPIKQVNGRTPLKERYRMYVIDQHNIAAGDDRFIFTIDTTKGTGASFQLPLRSLFTYDFIIDWGDGTSSEITAHNDPDITHNYSAHGIYQLVITGICQTWYFNNGGDKLKLISIDNWGNIGFAALGFVNAFYGCTNLITLPAGKIKSTAISSLDFVFYNCNKLTTIYEDIFEDLINVTTMGYCFYGCTQLTTLPKVSTMTKIVSFIECFTSTKIGTIPDDYFRYNVNVTSFNRVFNSCTSLRNLPNNLFFYNEKVNNYAYAFYNCRNLILPATIFNLTKLNIVTTFLEMFYTNSTAYSATGTIQDIWNYESGSAIKTRCFFNQTSITNYADIPASWK